MTSGGGLSGVPPATTQTDPKLMKTLTDLDGNSRDQKQAPLKKWDAATQTGRTTISLNLGTNLVFSLKNVAPFKKECFFRFIIRILIGNKGQNLEE